MDWGLLTFKAGLAGIALLCIDIYFNTGTYISLCKDTVKYMERENERINEQIEYEEYIQQPVYIYTIEEYGWASSILSSRSMDTVFIDNNIKCELMDAVDEFIDSAEWHEEKEIPYRLAIMLSGEPGSGKTSLITALANEYGLDIYNISINKCIARDYKLRDAVENIPRENVKLVVLEDLDSELGQLDSYGDVIPSLLELLDGFLSLQNVIIIITAQNQDAIPDDILARSRIDYNYIIEKPNATIRYKYFKWFYGDLVEDAVARDLADASDGMSMCEIQCLLRKNKKNPMNIFAQITIR